MIRLVTADAKPGTFAATVVAKAFDARQPMAAVRVSGEQQVVLRENWVGQAA